MFDFLHMTREWKKVRCWYWHHCLHIVNIYKPEWVKKFEKNIFFYLNQTRALHAPPTWDIIFIQKVFQVFTIFSLFYCFHKNLLFLLLFCVVYLLNTEHQWVQGFLCTCMVTIPCAETWELCVCVWCDKEAIAMKHMKARIGHCYTSAALYDIIKLTHVLCRLWR